MQTLEIGKIISQDEYTRQRVDPRPGDPLYLHLSDLRIGMGKIASRDSLRVLDFGCGGSPYKSLFPNAEYVRADLAGTPDIDLVIPEGDPRPRLEVDDSYFDLILSSQVLEHVPSHAGYLAECKRLLKRGGRLAITTHGVYEDHGCPFDFMRWTDAGLRRDISSAGFSVEELWKMTTGSRAAFFLLEQFFPRISAKTKFGFCFWPLRHMIDKKRALLHTYCDNAWSESRLVEDNLGEHKLYIGLGCVAVAK